MRRRNLLISSLLAAPAHRLAAQAPTAGTLFVIGGAEDRVHDRRILRRFLAHAGGTQARIRVLATASAVPLIVGDAYRRAFSEIGATDCELLPLLEGDAAFAPEVVQGILQADAVFITGGSQMRLMDVLRDTPALAALRHLHGQGGRCIAGTSAGAAVMSQHMITQGPAVRSPRKDVIGTGAGIGLLPAAIVDQHFSERGRLARLLSALAQRPDLLGVGVDEDTALIVEAGKAIEVIGSGAVTLVDASGLHTDIAQVEPQGAIEMLGLRLHNLPAGKRYALGASGQNAKWPGGLQQAVQRLVGAGSAGR